MENRDSASHRDLEALLQDWEECVEWIAHGWDCIEVYSNDVDAREVLQTALDRYQPCEPEPVDLMRRTAAADDRFRAVTEPSRLCVWHVGGQYAVWPNGEVELLFKPYDDSEYWYFYRWQPDSPYPWQEYDGVGYQKEFYGLDFMRMSEAELTDAARCNVARMDEPLKSRKRSWVQERTSLSTVQSNTESKQ